MRAPLGNLFQEDDAEEINMTPMLDVVFIMLIFFIVTASFVKEAGIDVNRPEAATAVKKERASNLLTPYWNPRKILLHLFRRHINLL